MALRDDVSPVAPQRLTSEPSTRGAVVASEAPLRLAAGAVVVAHDSATSPVTPRLRLVAKGKGTPYVTSEEKSRHTSEELEERAFKALHAARKKKADAKKEAESKAAMKKAKKAKKTNNARTTPRDRYRRPMRWLLPPLPFGMSGS